MIEEDDVREFIRRLPDLSQDPPTTHLIMLIVRSRYSKELTGVKAKDIVVERKIVRPTENNYWRERYLQKVYNLSILQFNGKYPMKDVIMPTKVLGILATLKPRSVLKSISKTMSYIGERFADGQLNNLARTDLKFWSNLHANKATGNPKLVTIDVDDADVYKEVLDYLESYHIWMITRTSRGFHIILNLGYGDDAKNFYIGGGTWSTISTKINKNISPLKVEIQRDSQEPVPGTFYYSPIRKNNYVEIVR